MRKIYMILSVFALGFYSCVSPDPVGEEPMEEKAAISLSADKISLAASADDQVEITVQTEGEWHVDGLTDGVRTWLSVSAESGADTTALTLSCKEDNLYTDARIAVLTFANADADAVLVVRQASDPERHVSLSVEKAVLGGKEGEEASVVVQTSKSWTLDGYTDDIQSWLEITPAAAENGGEIALRTKSVNGGPDNREAMIGFRIDKVNCVWLTVVQEVYVAPQTVTIQWAQDEFVVPEGAAYKAFPYYAASSMTATGVFTEGKDGEQIATGSITEVRKYIVKDKENSAPYYIEFGPTITPSGTALTYYCNNKNPRIRIRNAYIKTPAVEGYRLSHVKLTSNNAAASTCIYISKDIKTQEDYIVDGQSKVSFGKPNPVDVELTETTENTPYYIISDKDRYIESFELTYINVR